MATDLQPGPEASTTSLVAGIINDAQRLLAQQLALFRSEIKQDMHRTWQAGSLVGLGVGVGLVAAVVLVFALAHLIHWAWPQMPLWGAYGITGALVAVLAGALVYAGKKQFDSFNPLPDQSLEALQENVQWLTKNPK